MIVNLPWTPYFKSFSHSKAQIRIATLGDKYLQNLCACLGTNWYVYTTYEYTFPPIDVQGKQIQYVADVHFNVQYNRNLWDIDQYAMAVELDGAMNHSSQYAYKRDKMRDFLINEKHKCQTIRFQTFDISGHAFRKTKKRKKSKPIEPFSDIEILSEMNMHEFMKIPIPKSKHWSELIHKCRHNACINSDGNIESLKQSL